MSGQPQTAAPAPAPAVVVFGRNDKQKPHASSFDAGDAALAEKAAGLMGMRLLTVTTDAERALATRVPRGKIFASGKGFVPFVKGPLFAELEAACAPEAKPSDGGSAKASAAATSSVKQSEPVGDAAEETSQPKGWDDVRVGAIVLAAAPPLHNTWFECAVVSIKGGDFLILRYADWPKEPSFERHVGEVALMHPSRELDPPLDAEPQPSAA